MTYVAMLICIFTENMTYQEGNETNMDGILYIIIYLNVFYC